ncbi:hypothetical protein LPJ53_002381 [Coemansia erecta]|uniref:Uncharacterized protein n=1 Tax=Coemansia erecta TaxID=147472 RepID=A0A9W8CTK8_9FUNG|nr:hypothetical protein LPJ53_002381 [Coemansia erecta]
MADILLRRALQHRRPIPPFRSTGVAATPFPPPLSKFQILPPDVVDRIIDYTLDGVNPTRKKFWRKGYPLLQVCKNWRMTFIQKEFSEMTIELKRSLPFKLSFTKHAYPANPRLYPIETCVRNLTFVVVSWKRLAEGQTLEWMRSSVEMGRIDAAAIRSLKIEGFSGDEWNTYFKNDTAAAITRLVEFLRYLHETFPNVKSVSVNILRWEFLKYIPKDDLQLEPALAALFSGREVTMYAKFIKDSFKTINPSYFTGITSLNIESANCYNYVKHVQDWILKVVRLNAPSLQKLHLCVINDEWLKDITHSKAGNQMVYPKLKSIKTRVASLRFTADRDRTHAFAMGELPGHEFRHFPALEHINLHGQPFVSRWVAPDSDVE